MKKKMLMSVRKIHQFGQEEASEDARAKVLKIARNYAMCLVLISISS